MHARRVRPDTGHIDRRRLAAAGLSAVLPGLGQAFNRRSRLAAVFLIPSLVLLLLGFLLLSSQSLTRLAAFVVSPPVLATLLTINLLLLGWRLLAVGQAFLDTGNRGPTGRVGLVGWPPSCCSSRSRTCSSISTAPCSATRSPGSSSLPTTRLTGPDPLRGRRTTSV